jgi:S-DNA-T family DNA segregation ATPase FtsK/SpoIIIE
MRLALTIVSPRMRWSADIVLDADPAAPVAEFAAALAGFGYDSRPVRAEMLPGPPLFIGGRRLSPEISLAQSPLRDGAVVSVGSPAGCR